MQLKPGTTLQNGKYEIIRPLGQGGFGITYVAEQVALNREVAIKEFFMKEYCERDDSTSQVMLGTTAGNRDLVTKFREKFVREARMIARLDHPNVVKIYDVFEENGTAYYVMEYIANGSLKELIAEQGAIDEKTALKYIAEAGEALRYVHNRKILHFDVKPSNIMLRDSGTTALIDFGVSKHFDESGHVTSSTPIGISKGYAPMEQYRQEDISTFTPATDVYALGATLYTLVTGKVPPDASEVYEDGLPDMPGTISKATRTAIIKAMSPKRKDRPQEVEAFLRLLGLSTNAPKKSNPGSVLKQDSEKTELAPIPMVRPSSVMKEKVPVGKDRQKSGPKPELLHDTKPKKKSNKGLFVGVISAVVAAAVIIGMIIGGKEEPGSAPAIPVSVTDHPFTNAVLGEYLYTGPVDSEGQPDGEGKAVFVKNKDQEALSYSGPFVHGVMQGTGASFTFITGDTFNGSFGEDNHFLEGVLTKKESGEYFEGSFKDGVPLNGVWYDKNGKKLQDVKNGK